MLLLGQMFGSMWRKESKAKIIIGPYLLTINYLLYKSSTKTMKRCKCFWKKFLTWFLVIKKTISKNMHYFFERRHTVLISYSKEDFSKYLHIYKSNLGRVVYELYKYSKFRQAECNGMQLPCKMFASYSDLLYFKYLSVITHKLLIVNSFFFIHREKYSTFMVNSGVGQRRN